MRQPRRAAHKHRMASRALRASEVLRLLEIVRTVGTSAAISVLLSRDAGPGASIIDARLKGKTAAPARLHVLVVDDNADVRDTLGAMLENLGLKVSVASTGMQALEMWDAGCSCDIVLTDVVMPGVNGTDLAAVLRQQRPQLPIVFMTGRDSVVDRALDDGIVVLMKPFTGAQLWRVIEELTKDAHRSEWLRRSRSANP